MYEDIISVTKQYESDARRETNLRFFKTGKGEYGEGDEFVGISMPHARLVAKQFRGVDLTDVRRLVKSKIHEYRMIGLLILTYKFEKADENDKKRIFEFLIEHRAGINSWDLVDVICPRIVGGYLLGKDPKILYDFAVSNDLWERRIAIVSTWWFIRAGELDDTYALSKLLLQDSHDLIHKAVGWMLREAGKKDEGRLYAFLDKHIRKMPRTMVRYAIEKFDDKKYEYYLKLK